MAMFHLYRGVNWIEKPGALDAVKDTIRAKQLPLDRETKALQLADYKYAVRYVEGDIVSCYKTDKCWDREKNDWTGPMHTDKFYRIRIPDLDFKDAQPYQYSDIDKVEEIGRMHHKSRYRVNISALPQLKREQLERDGQAVVTRAEFLAALNDKAAVRIR